MIGECLLHQFWSLSTLPQDGNATASSGAERCHGARWGKSSGKRRALSRWPQVTKEQPEDVRFHALRGNHYVSWSDSSDIIASEFAKICGALGQHVETEVYFTSLIMGLIHCWNMLKSNSFLFVGPDRQPRPIRSAADGSVEVLCAQNTAPWTDRDKSLWSYGQVIGWKFCEKEERWCS